ncbi:MAG: preprotein translocase subunit SecE [Bacilli bacterium]|nr:preprotein translocase subunit SecE [Bacilli bacterium]
MSKILNFFHGVKKEAKRSHWPSGKELFRYSVITIIMIAFFGAFFYVLDILFAFLKGIVS